MLLFLLLLSLDLFLLFSPCVTITTRGLTAAQVVNIVRKPDQVQLLANEGAQYTLLESDPAFNEKFSQLCMQLSATILFDAVGGSLTGRLLNLMPDRSVAVVYGGLSATPVSQVDLRDLIFRGKQVLLLLLLSPLYLCVSCGRTWNLFLSLPRFLVIVSSGSRLPI